MVVLRWLATAALAVAGLGLLPVVASADLGVGIQNDPIIADGPIAAGSSQALPVVYVKNTGTEPGSVVLRVEKVDDGSDRKLIPPEWVTFEPQLVDLDAGEGANIAIRVAVPRDADVGEFGSHIIAASQTRSADGSLTGAQVGAQAATALEFTVTASAVSFWDRVVLPLWAVLALSIGGGLVVLLLVGRLLGLRVSIKRAE